MCCYIFFFQFNQDDVDYPMPDLMHDYPPRLIFDLSPSESARPCIFWLKVTGMTKDVDFQFELKSKTILVVEIENLLIIAGSIILVPRL